MAKSRAELVQLSDRQLENELSTELKAAQSGSDAVMRVLEEYSRRASIAQMDAAKANKSVAKYTMVAALIAAMSLVVGSYFQYKTYRLAEVTQQQNRGTK
ncbi:hypothetical protein [Rhodoplanes sp. SY1]|uniref:hypothetical protein n=1 Tax=Rhodoplanes sp. SY1 TaxID=3166646 RepID=UPI0038B44F1C